MTDSEQREQEPGSSEREEGTSSVRVAIVVFLVTMMLLGGMALYWFSIRL